MTTTSSYTGQVLAGQRAIWEPEFTALSGKNAKCIPGYRVGEYAFPLLHDLVLRVMTIGKASLAVNTVTHRARDGGAVVCLKTSSLGKTPFPRLWCLQCSHRGHDSHALPIGLQKPLTRRGVGQGRVVPGRKFAQEDSAFSGGKEAGEAGGVRRLEARRWSQRACGAPRGSVLLSTQQLPGGQTGNSSCYGGLPRMPSRSFVLMGSAPQDASTVPPPTWIPQNHSEQRPNVSGQGNAVMGGCFPPA